MKNMAQLPLIVTAKRAPPWACGIKGGRREPQEFSLEFLKFRRSKANSFGKRLFAERTLRYR